MDDFFDAYERSLHRVSDLIGHDPASSQVSVPACPSWTVHDVVAHLVGLAEDVVVENTEDYAEPSWTDTQVARRRGVDLALVLADWQTISLALRQARLPTVAHGYGSLGRLVFVDAAIHEHDLRGALDVPAPDNEAVEVGLASSIDVLARMVRRHQLAGALPTLRLTATDVESWLIGSDGTENEVTVEATAFELWRGMTGRRSLSQVEALHWGGDPGPYLDHWVPRPLALAARELDY